MEERKIMVEVTKEEYEKIKAGILEVSIPTYEDVKQDLIKDLSKEDIELLLKKHQQLILDSVTDDALVAQIIRRTKDKGNPVIMFDPVKGAEYTTTRGELKNLKKRDYSIAEEPIIQSHDNFSWTLQCFNERL